MTINKAAGACPSYSNAGYMQLYNYLYNLMKMNKKKKKKGVNPQFLVSHHGNDGIAIMLMIIITIIITTYQ